MELDSRILSVLDSYIFRLQKIFTDFAGSRGRSNVSLPIFLFYMIIVLSDHCMFYDLQYFGSNIASVSKH